MTAESNLHRQRLRTGTAVATLAIVAICALLIGADAYAIDGNYSSPYASQYDNRSAGAMLSTESLIGMLLLVANLVLAGFFAIRERRRRCRAAA